MASSSMTTRWQRGQMVMAATVVTVTIVFALYWAQNVFIPVALAVFLSFLLSPLVSFLQRRGLGRFPSVLLAVTLASLVIVTLFLIITHQFTALGQQLPEYTPNIKAKVRALRDAGMLDGTERLDQMIEEITAEFSARPAGEPETTAVAATTKKEPTTVVVSTRTPAWLTYLAAYVPSVLQAIVIGGFTLVLVFFMLLRREDLRNRFIRMTGRGQLTLTTRAVDDAAHRISRFLMMQLIVNATYAVVLTAGLFALQMDYALLWGALAFALRYIPYLGTWLAVIPPTLLSLASSPGWFQPLAVFSLFIGLEILSNNLLEPWVYGKSVGASEVGLLVMAAIWALLWGPIGLMISTPLTVCLVVLGRFVPRLEFLDVLLGDSPPLNREVMYYQRLLAHDQDEAGDIARATAKETSRDQVFDDLMIPALCYARRDRERDELDERDEEVLLRATREIAADLEEPQNHRREPQGPCVRVLALATRDAFDEAALQLFKDMLGADQCDLEITPSEMLTGEAVEAVAQKKPAAILIASLPPGGLAHARYLCKRLRNRFPDIPILVGRWGLKGNIEQNQDQLRAEGANQIATTLAESKTHLSALLPVLPEGEAPLADEAVPASINGNGRRKPRKG